MHIALNTFNLHKGCLILTLIEAKELRLEFFEWPIVFAINDLMDHLHFFIFSFVNSWIVVFRFTTHWACIFFTLKPSLYFMIIGCFYWFLGRLISVNIAILYMLCNSYRWFFSLRFAITSITIIFARWHFHCSFVFCFFLLRIYNDFNHFFIWSICHIRSLLFFF